MPKFSVLIIEDEKNIQTFMRKILIRHDYRVLCADAGTEGLSLIRSQCPDLVLLDLGLPDMNGNQIIQDVKFKTFGCGAAVATSSMATEMVKGKSVQEAMEVTNKAVMEALDGLPPVKVHCSLLAEEAIHAALWDYAEKHGIKIEGLKKPKSDIHEGEEAEEEEY